jgi:hypothetical protein
MRYDSRKDNIICRNSKIPPKNKRMHKDEICVPSHYNVTPQKIPVGFGLRKAKIPLPAFEAGRIMFTYIKPFS